MIQASVSSFLKNVVLTLEIINDNVKKQLTQKITIVAIVIAVQQT